ncbi:MAG: rhodanese-like domain-containing protein [Desulfomonile tiedjei]|uniref:Rhodanese-like domain-containing protein n=1 Tax=Desulfomonile tiedjei TaxID=2358 RepID=A0A9D6V2N2_9BACT|nr:rhodanese-like domain-containing protein [Desulfomonile tiedjei]
MSIHINKKRLLIPIALALVSVGAWWQTSRSVTPRESTWDDVTEEAKSGGYRLISGNELEQLYEKRSGKTLLVDTRQEWEFAAGHIKTAVNFPIEPVRWSAWWKKADLAPILGPDKDRVVIFY